MSSADQHLTVDVDAGSAPARVAVTGEVDAASAPSLASAITEASSGQGDVVLDLGGVTFIDSSGLRVIATAVRAAQDAGHTVRVSVASDVVERIFAMTGLSGLIES